MVQFRWVSARADSAEFFEIRQTGEGDLEVEWIENKSGTWRRNNFGDSSANDISEWAVIQFEPLSVNPDPYAMSNDIPERLGLGPEPLPPLNGEDPIGDPPDPVDDVSITLFTLIQIAAALVNLVGKDRARGYLQTMLEQMAIPGIFYKIENFAREVRNILSDVQVRSSDFVKLEDPENFYLLWPELNPRGGTPPVNGTGRPPVTTPIMTGDPIGDMVGAMTVSTWIANGITFYRLSDGRLAARKKTGVWSIWRPKKPTVIYSQGPNNINDILKADAIIDKQMKKAAKALRRRGWKVSRG